MVIRRRFRQGRQISGLARRQLLQSLVEVGLRGGNHAVGVLAEKNLVQIEFKDLVFGQRAFKSSCENDFLDLPVE